VLVLITGLPYSILPIRCTDLPIKCALVREGRLIPRLPLGRLVTVNLSDVQATLVAWCPDYLGTSYDLLCGIENQLDVAMAVFESGQVSRQLPRKSVLEASLCERVRPERDRRVLIVIY
jgi:hypothetical protein